MSPVHNIQIPRSPALNHVSTGQAILARCSGLGYTSFDNYFPAEIVYNITRNYTIPIDILQFSVLYNLPVRMTYTHTRTRDIVTIISSILWTCGSWLNVDILLYARGTSMRRDPMLYTDANVVRNAGDLNVPTCNRCKCDK